MAPSNSHSNWHVRCVSVPGPDTDLSLHVVFDNARFLFGCGEATQRAFVQKRLGLRGLNAIFLPNSESRTRGGLPGEFDTEDAEPLRMRRR
jgi:ribonuclease Z